MLYKVQTHYGDGRVTNELISSPAPFSIKPSQDGIKICIANVLISLIDLFDLDFYI